MAMPAGPSGLRTSGRYTEVHKSTPAPYIHTLSCMHTLTHAGVYLSLKGTTYANSSAIPITEIGETDPDTDLNDGLQCITGRMPCCRHAFRAGEWYMYTPGRTMVPGLSTAVGFYRNRGHDDGTVNLNRPDGVMMPTGLFCCEIPSATGGDQTVCANIGKRWSL